MTYLPVKARNHIHAVIPGRCVPCPRARVSKFGTHYPKRYQDWHDMAQKALEEQCGAPLWEDTVNVIVEFASPRVNADLDNLLKSVFDALQGVIICDDVQVHSVSAWRDRGEPRTVVDVIKLPDA